MVGAPPASNAMSIPQTIFHPEHLEKRVGAGWLRRQTDGDTGLQIFNYTEAVQYGRLWDKYTLACRGLVLDHDYNLVALPFAKFFNLGEPCCPALPEGRDVSFEAYEKVDGSLGIWFFHNGEWRVATRGSFKNDYTDWAYKNAPDLSNFPTHWTVMTEICMPAALDGMPRAVQHEPGIYYLGATDLHSIQGVNGGDVCPSTSAHLWKGPIANLHPAASIDDLTHKAKHHEGAEGWVIRYRTGLRVKIKTTWYLHIFRAISALNEKHVKELMLKAGLDEWLKDFPEELQDEARSIYEAIQGRFVTRRDSIMRDFARINAASLSTTRDYKANRKAFALAVKDHPEKGYLFMLYDHQNIDAKLLEDC